MCESLWLLLDFCFHFCATCWCLHISAWRRIVSAHIETKAEHLCTSMCLTPSEWDVQPNWLRLWWTGLMRSSPVQRWDANRTCKHAGVAAKRCECLPLLAVSPHAQQKKRKENSDTSAAWIQNWEKKKKKRWRLNCCRLSFAFSVNFMLGLRPQCMRDQQHIKKKINKSMNFQGGPFVSNPEVYWWDDTKVNKPSLNADLSPDPLLHCD